MYYSAMTHGFYSKAIHGNGIPDGVVEIGDDAYAALMEAQAAGKLIQADETGYPVAVSPPRPTAGELATSVRVERDKRLTESDWTQMPDSPLSAEAKAAWVAYRQALRDLPGQEGFPWGGEFSAVPWPQAPAA